MHYLITGHTGFKGSWLSLMLHLQGHSVSGISLNPLEKSLFRQADLQDIFKSDRRIDIRDTKGISRAIREIDPEIILHLAAQPLVRESYKDPLSTYETNVLGTLNLLEATKQLTNLKATLIITTDKVYKNKNHLRGYVEADELGGDDPYSASKAAADIAAQSWIKCFSNSPVGIARAGNVIGGGDWATDRIIPDLVSAYSANKVPILRYPEAIRPWQHVLDCLNGYLKLINKMLVDATVGEWNFGPSFDEQYSVSDLAEAFAQEWGLCDEKIVWLPEKVKQPHEAGNLLLDSSKSREKLDWRDKLSFEQCVKLTVHWFKESQVKSPREVTISQIEEFLNLS